MSNIILPLILVVTCLFGKTVARVVCNDPTEIGELRVLQSKLCVDISGRSGGGNVLAYRCEGLDDQQIIMCGDGTIRSTQASYNCLTSTSNGNVESATCQVYPVVPNKQRWKLGRSKRFIDNGGIAQEATEIINVGSGLCLDVTGSSGSGNILTYQCQNENDQYFYFRNRGKLLKYGRLQNEKSGLCLDVSGSSGGHGKNILIYSCEDNLDQYFSFYENGELVNKKSRLCVDVSGNQGSGNILMWSCVDAVDQLWSQPNQYCHGGYCSFLNRKSGKCMDVSGSAATKGSNVLAYSCVGAPDQAFRWLNSKWIAPTATWTLVGCNQNGKISHAVRNTISYSSSISRSMSVEVGDAIEAEVIFGGVPVTTTVSNTLLMEWERRQSQTGTVTFTCNHYDTGKPFTGGCMWKLKLDTKKATNRAVLSWSPMIVKCTRGNGKPRCPPFTKCADDDCQRCQKMPGARKKRSIDKLLTWEEVVNYKGKRGDGVKYE